MDLIQQLQEQYLQEFSSTIRLDRFFINMFTTALLVSLLRLYYVRFGQAIANRRRFADNFLPLALGTLLIITIVKSSIALSLGLVGALSIVRYRAAIKDPEELTYLFIAIGLGLAGGANQPVLAIVAFSVILLLLYVSRLLQRRQTPRPEGRLFIHIDTDSDDLQRITDLLSGQLPYVALKRMDTVPEGGLSLSYTCQVKSLADLSTLQAQILDLSANTRLSIVDQPDLIV